MFIGRILGWVFMAGALFAIGYEISESIQAGVYVSVALGELWHQTHSNSLLGFQAFIQRDEDLGMPWLWESWIAAILRWPTWIVLGGIGAGLLFLFRRRPRNR